MTNSISELEVSNSVLLKAKALNHLQRVLLQKKSISLGRLFQRVGVGLTSQQFEGLVRVLVDGGFCTISTGKRIDSVIVTLNVPEVEPNEER